MRSTFKILIFYFGVFAIITPACKNLCAQELFIVKKPKIYLEEVLKDSNYQMLEVKSVIPTIVYDLRYSTTNNFTREQLYKDENKTYLRKPVLEALADIQKELSSIGYGLKIFDAYRPYKATEKMWKLIGDERFAANPKKGSNHNRGLAVDVTLIELKTGKELDMGTGFDSFTDTAHTSFINIPKHTLKNRFLLKEVMIKHGFHILETEWWHFTWENDRNYSVLDLSFKELAKLTD
jgi:D-alanyl-D-alanine dipeptidase